MNKNILIVLLVIVAFVLGILFNGLFSFTGQTIKGLEDNLSENITETFTMAVCNEGKECVDVLVSCVNGSVSSLELVSDVVKLGENWQDLREFDGLC